MSQLKEGLKDILEEDDITDEDFETILYSHDLVSLPKLLKKLYKTIPDVVVRPKNTDQIVRIVKYAREKKIPITPKGASTSITGSSMPTRGGIALDLSSMNNILDLDKKNRQVEVEPGVIWEHLEKYLDKNDLTLNVYPTSAPASTVGGWVSASGLGYGTGGIGIGSAKYGAIGDNTLALEIVLPNGEVKNIPSEEYKVQDFVGSDGTLGIITKTTLKVRKKPETIKTYAYSFQNTDDMLNTLNMVSKTVKIYFSEFEDQTLQETKKQAGIPTHSEANIVSFTLEGKEKEVKKDHKKIDKITKENNGEYLGDEIGDETWNTRTNPIRIKKAGPSLVTSEFTVKTKRLKEAFDGVKKIGKKYKVKLGILGALVKDGSNIAPILLKDERKDIDYMLSLSITKEFNDLAVSLGGKPYGAGHFNTFYAKEIHGERLERLKELKKELDPDNIINPTKSLKHTTRFGVAMPKAAYSATMKTFSLLQRLGIGG